MTGVDISQEMLAIARRRAQSLGRPVHLTTGDAQRLPYGSDRFDAVVSTLSLCTVPDEHRALAEVWRTLRPGGRLILLEHVRSPNRLVRTIQRYLEPLANRVAGDHLLRDPLDDLSDAGFAVDSVDKSRAGMVERVIARKVVLGGTTR